MVIFAHSLVNTVGANMGYHSWQKQERFKGAVNISLSGNASDDFDLNSFSWRNPTGSEWPRNGLYGTQFLHSDIKNIALPFVSTSWESITAIAGFAED